MIGLQSHFKPVMKLYREPIDLAAEECIVFTSIDPREVLL